MNDIRIASGYRGALQRTSPLEECHYDPSLLLNDPLSTKMGRVCPASGVNWNEDAAWKLALEGPTRVRQLLLGPQDDGAGHTPTGCVVPFDRTTLPTAGPDDDNDGMGKESPEDDSVLSLCLEASHAAPRIIHHADCTGRAITESITKAAAAHPLIEFRGDSIVTDLIADEDGDGMVIGAKVLDKSTNRIGTAYAVHGVVLASGGLGGIYEHSTNPGGFNALGSSVALALRLEERLDGSPTSAGSGITSDLEYVQFHPTSLCLPNEARFLLTEALRGEGAILRDASGRAFAADYHPAAELAPRDIVARAVFTESQKAAADGGHNAFLDMTHRDASWLKDRFPTIHSHLSSRGSPMDFTKERIPVIPAAHYTCGGVTSDLSGRVRGAAGRVHRNLYVAGEAARTGLHGGNRLASTSLLEGLVYGSSVGELVAGVVVGDDGGMEEREELIRTMEGARYAIERRLAVEEQSYSSEGDARRADERAGDEASALLARLKSVMWDGVGVVRTPSGLADAASELAAMRDEAESVWDRAGGGDWRAAAVRDAARSGLAVAEAAKANGVSGGAHYVLREEAGSEPADDVAAAGAAGGGFGGDEYDDEEEALVAAVVL